MRPEDSPLACPQNAANRESEPEIRACAEDGTVSTSHEHAPARGHADDLTIRDLAVEVVEAERQRDAYAELLRGALAGWHEAIREQRRLEGRLARLLDELREVRRAGKERRAA